jgi:hypothetical protein
MEIDFKKLGEAYANGLEAEAGDPDADDYSMDEFLPYDLIEDPVDELTDAEELEPIKSICKDMRLALSRGSSVFLAIAYDIADDGADEDGAGDGYDADDDDNAAGDGGSDAFHNASHAEGGAASEIDADDMEEDPERHCEGFVVEAFPYDHPEMAEAREILEGMCEDGDFFENLETGEKADIDYITGGRPFRYFTRMMELGPIVHGLLSPDMDEDGDLPLPCDVYGLSLKDLAAVEAMDLGNDDGVEVSARYIDYTAAVDLIGATRSMVLDLMDEEQELGYWEVPCTAMLIEYVGNEVASARRYMMPYGSWVHAYGTSGDDGWPMAHATISFVGVESILMGLLDD